MYKYINNQEKEQLIKTNKSNTLLISKNNELYLKQEYNKTKSLLDNITGYSLDKEQRKCILIEENKILINAGAGSGKTLTIIGKIRHLIEYKKVDENKILCISFTNETVNSLKNKIEKYYKYNINIYTFHKLSLEIINKFKEINIIDDLLLDEIIKKNNFIKNKKLITTFINIYKSLYNNNEKIKELFIKNYNYKNHQILKEIYRTYYEYTKTLNKLSSIDFNDMLISATKYVKEAKLDYEYIIIDEYQDTSLTRFKLIREIIKYTNAKIIVVGDDFQSIYKFTGCDIDLFINFKKYFPYCETLKISNTYRNANQLIDIAGSFVMKNKYQIKKKLKSNINISKPVKIIYTNNETKAIENILKKHEKEEIFIIGRNNYDFDKYKIKLNNKHRYITAHKSKGLESEITILINLTNKIDGFPNKIKNHKLINKLLPKENYKYAEERRLFYVALTRTKTITYLIVDRKNPSEFIKEIKKSKYIEIYKS